MKSTANTRARKSSLKAKREHLILATVVLVLCATVFGCSGSEKPKVEAAPSPATVEARKQQLASMPPPELNQVQQAVKRVFKDSAIVDVSRQPSFLAGDFNGDLSQDLAVIVRPGSGKLAEINEESPRWILRDLFRPSEPGTPVKVEENEVLLAIIHGYGSDGWRDSQATQTYLLKNAVGSEMGVKGGKEIMAANSGKALPRFQGDLLNEVIRGSTGYLYFAGSTYSWYDPKTFKGESQSQAVHGRAPAAKP